MNEIDPNDTHEILRLMRSHTYFHGLDEEILQVVAENTSVHRFETGEFISRANEPVTRIGFVSSGRVKGSVVDGHGSERLLRFVGRGEAIGLLSTALPEPAPVNVVAVEPTTVLLMDHAIALELTSRYPTLRAHWTRKLAVSLRSVIIGDTKRTETSVVVLFHQSPKSRELTRHVVAQLSELGESIGLFSDLDFSDLNSEQIFFRGLVENDTWLSEGAVNEQIGAWGRPKRVVIDVDSSIPHEIASRLVAICHQAVWFADESNHQYAVAQLRTLESNSPAIRDKVVFAWALETSPTAPAAAGVHQVAGAQINIFSAVPAPSQGRAITLGVHRLVNHLRGLCVGVALGGGAARGMAHLGVLRALEKNGIVIDRIAGTSAGAMTGLLYGAGFEPNYLVEHFVEDLTPSRLFRWLPRGGYWYLMYKYRLGQFNPMLRKYLESMTIEQLPIPTSAIAVDLVSGQAVIRDSGDAVNAILDSINLPLLSVPIIRGGQVLIDGGFLNNVPADVLVSQGCNFVIAVDVMSTIKEEFAGICPASPEGQGRAPNAIQTLLRTYDVQSYNMKSLGMQPADVFIMPNTSEYSMSAFTKAAELADIGERATVEKMPMIKSLLSRFSTVR